MQKSIYSKGSNSGKTIIKKKIVLTILREAIMYNTYMQLRKLGIKLLICAAYMNKHVKFLQWYLLYENQ